MVDHLQRAYAVDKQRRTDGWQPQNTSGWRTRVVEVTPGEVYADSLVRVSAFRVPHGNWPDAFGYRLQTRDRVIVVSGDTRASDAVAEACNGCDVLVHEVYGDSAFATLRPEWSRYHGHFHTGAAALAALATRARPGLLILTHTLTWNGVPRGRILEEVRRGFGGRVVLPNDLEVF